MDVEHRTKDDDAIEDAVEGKDMGLIDGDPESGGIQRAQ